MNRQKYYGIIGNGETCALISKVGNIEWLCLPQFDSQVVYSKIVSSMGHSLDIDINDNGRELDALKSSQEYIEGTAVLKTRLQFSGLSAQLTDFMPWPEPEAMESEKRIIFRILSLQNTSGKSKKFTVKVRINRGGNRKEIRENKIFRHDSCVYAITFLKKSLEIKLRPKELVEVPIILVYGVSEDEVRKTLSKLKLLDAQLQLQKCIGLWKNWIDKSRTLETLSADYTKAYKQSLVTMKLLTFEKNGAIIAASTSSLPASIVGTHSWDYRFMWVRDAYYACRAFLASNHFYSVKRQLSFLFSVQEKDGHWASPFYTIDGRMPGDEIDIDRGEAILRLNNAAKSQLQLDSEGSVIYMAYMYFLYSKDIEFLQKHMGNIEAAANWICKNYMKEENGIWEFRHKTAQWTYGKVMCYVGIDAAMKIIGLLDKKVPEHWTKTRSLIKKYIVKNSWSDYRKAFVQTYDKDSSVDISVLALEDYGIVKPFDKRMKSTIRLIESKLSVNDGIKRNEDAHLPFYFATLWLAAHYIRVGNEKRAREIIDLCINSSTNLYMCAEHFDPASGLQYGNFPQAFSASMLVERILEIEKKEFSLEKILDLLGIGIRKITHYDRDELIKWSEASLEYRKK